MKFPKKENFLVSHKRLRMIRGKSRHQTEGKSSQRRVVKRDFIACFFLAIIAIELNRRCYPIQDVRLVMALCVQQTNHFVQDPSQLIDESINYR